MSLPILNNGEQNGPVKLELVKFRVIGKPYSKWKEIFAETGGDETLFKVALYQGYGIRIDGDGDPMLYIIEDTAQRRELLEIGVHNPTFAQLLTSTKVLSLSEQDAIDQMNAWLDANRVSTEPTQPQ